MLSAAIPYVRSRTRGVVDTTLLKTHTYGRAVRKLRSYIEIPAFDIANTWRGASEIITRFEFSSAYALSLLEKFPIEAPDDANFCPVVSWLKDGVFYRYKLWENVGEILWLPLYEKQKITQTYFFIEIWNTDSRTQLALQAGEDQALDAGGYGILLGYSDTLNLLLAEAIRVYTSRRIIPDYLCQEDDVALAAATECVDPIFQLEDFQPIFGDYYIFDGHCARQLIKGTIGIPAAGYNILQSSDDTWHYVWFTTDVEGSVTTYVQQDDAVPPLDALGYFPIIVNGTTGTVYKVALQVSPGEPTPNHTLSIKEELDINDISDYAAHVFAIQHETNGNRYGFGLRYLDDAPQMRIIQTPI